MTIGILPNVNLKSRNRDVGFGAECSFPHWKVKEQPNKRPKKGGDKSAVAIVKDVRQMVCVSQDAEPSESSAILLRAQKSWDQFNECNSRGLHCVKRTSEQKKVHHLVKYKSKFLIGEVPTQ